MPVYSQNGQLIHPSDPNYAAYAAQNNPAPQGSTNTPPPNTPPTNPPTNGTTPNDAYGNLLYETPEEKAYREALERQGEEARLRGETNVDENSIRNNVTDRFQAEIDALNRIYAEKKKIAFREGEGRLGSDAAIQSRRGLLGSTFGGAQTEKVGQFNNEIQSGIDSELQANLSQIYSKIKTDVASELAAKTEAKKAGASEYLEFLRGSAERKQQRVSNTVRNMLLNNLNPDDAMFKGLAEQLGVSVDSLKASYNELKSASDSASEDKRLERAKTQSEIDKNYGGMEIDLQKLGLDMDKFNYQQKQDTIKNAFEDTKFTWLQKQDLIKNELEKSKLVFDQSKDARDYELSLQKFLLEADKAARDSGEIVKINGVDYQKNADGTYSQPKVPRVPSEDKLKKTDDVLKMIEDIYNNKDLSNAIGPKSSQIPQWMRTGKRNAVDAMIDTLISNLTIDNLGVLKGAMSDKDIEFLKSVSTNGLRKDSDLNTFKQRLEEIKEKFTTIKTKVETEKRIRLENPNLSDDEIDQIIGSFNGVDGDTNSAVKKLNKPYLKTLGAITGLDGSPLWKNGLDVDLKKGDPVRSPVSGRVLATRNNGGFGLQVKILADDGREIWLSHLDGSKVKQGDKIALGQLVGIGGNSGNTIPGKGGDGSHLDITIKSNGKFFTAREVKSYLDNIIV